MIAGASCCFVVQEGQNTNERHQTRTEKGESDQMLGRTCWRVLLQSNGQHWKVRDLPLWEIFKQKLDGHLSGILYLLAGVDEMTLLGSIQIQNSTILSLVYIPQAAPWFVQSVWLSYVDLALKTAANICQDGVFRTEITLAEENSFQSREAEEIRKV